MIATGQNSTEAEVPGSQHSDEYSDSYVLADNLETSCYLMKFLNVNNVPLPLSSRSETFETITISSHKLCNESAVGSWCSFDDDSGEEDDQYSYGEIQNFDETACDEKLVLNESISELPCSLPHELECQAQTKSTAPGIKCVRFPPIGKEVSKAFDCPWQKQCDDYFVLFYTAREIQQMKDSNKFECSIQTCENTK